MNLSTKKSLLGKTVSFLALCQGMNSVAEAANVNFDSAAEVLTINAVTLGDTATELTTLSASLKLISKNPIQFELVEGAEIEAVGGYTADFDVDNLMLSLPEVSIDGFGAFNVSMKLVPDDAITFEVTDFAAVTGGKSFNRIASFPVFLNTDIESETVAEIVDVSQDGNTLVYTDAETGHIGFVDIVNPANPIAAGVVKLDGEPTSVAVAGQYALAAVNTSESFTNPSGVLNVIDLATKTVIEQKDLGGQPDAVAVSPDGRYAAIVIENERDEDLGDGEPPQAPSGFLVIVDLVGEPSEWTLRNVSLDNIADLFPEDVEPEYVDINASNIAVLSLQENNHMILVDLSSGEVTAEFSAGAIDLNQIDTEEEDPALISLNTSAASVAREPDGVSWISETTFATANEGDLFGGSRGYSIFNTAGEVIFDSGNTLDHEAVRLGHYPDGRSGNKGNEPENVDYGVYGSDQYLFVASERSNLLFVENLSTGERQILPAGVGPEGVKAIPQRGLLIAASEKDDRGDKYRSVLNIYQLQHGAALYPTVKSADREDSTPIPWGALSGLAMSKTAVDTAYTTHDSFYQQSRIFALDVSQKPALINQEIVLQDANGLVTAVSADLVNADQTVNLDLEGIAVSAAGGFWLASEGRGTVGDEDRPFETPNLVLHVTAEGVIDNVVQLPQSTNDRQVRFGLEGVAATGAADSEVLWVAFQREWGDDIDGHTRIGRYDVVEQQWSFYYYPLDEATSPNGGWVGLSEITAIDDHQFAVIERDNQGSVDARIKKVYRFDVSALTPLPDVPVGVTPAFFPVIEKTLVVDLMPTLKQTGGQVLEKIEGMTIAEDKTLLIINDNDGVDDSNGETQLFRLKNLLN